MRFRPWKSMGHLFRGTRILVGTPALWPVACAPLALATLGYLALVVGSFWLVVPRLTETLARWMPESVGWTTGSVLFGLAWLILSAPVFLALVCGVSIPSWDVLSRKVELVSYGSCPGERLRFRHFALDAAARMFVALIGSVLSLVLTLIGFGWISALLIGWIILFDVTAPASLRRGFTYWRQPGLVLRDPGFLVLWLCASVVAFVPFLNLLFMPLFVCAGTLLVASAGAKGEANVGQPVE